jgi:hypothetical protein
MSAREEALFVSKFTAHCAVKKLDFLEEGRNKVNDIDNQIEKLDKQRAELRWKRNSLVRFLKAQGLDATVNKYRPDGVTIPIDDDNPIAVDLRRSIINYLEKNKSATIRQLIESICKHDSDSHANLIRQVKVLANSCVLTRADDDKIVTGGNWENRHQAL